MIAIESVVDLKIDGHTEYITTLVCNDISWRVSHRFCFLYQVYKELSKVVHPTKVPLPPFPRKKDTVQAIAYKLSTAKRNTFRGDRATQLQSFFAAVLRDKTYRSTRIIRECFARPFPSLVPSPPTGISFDPGDTGTVKFRIKLDGSCPASHVVLQGKTETCEPILLRMIVDPTRNYVEHVMHLEPGKLYTFVVTTESTLSFSKGLRSDPISVCLLVPEPQPSCAPIKIYPPQPELLAQPEPEPTSDNGEIPESAGKRCKSVPRKRSTMGNIVMIDPKSDIANEYATNVNTALKRGFTYRERDSRYSSTGLSSEVSMRASANSIDKRRSTTKLDQSMEEERLISQWLYEITGCDCGNLQATLVTGEILLDALRVIGRSCDVEVPKTVKVEIIPEESKLGFTFKSPLARARATENLTQFLKALQDGFDVHPMDLFAVSDILGAVDGRGNMAPVARSLFALNRNLPESYDGPTIESRSVVFPMSPDTCSTISL